MYEIYVDGVKVATHDNYFDVATSKAFWKIIFNKEVKVISKQKQIEVTFNP